MSFKNNWKFIAIIIVMFILFGINLVIGEGEIKKIETLENQLNQTNRILSGVVNWSYQANNLLNDVVNRTNSR